jgi:hypothetical protein
MTTTSAVCTFPDCGRPRNAFGLCQRHRIQQRAGEPLRPIREGYYNRNAGAMRWLVAAIAQPPSGCLDWPFAKHEKGYGQLKVQGATRKVTHLVLEMSGRPRPAGLHALHSCDRPSCINPTHLSWGTNAENQRQKAERGRKRSAYLR